jgi:integrase
MTRRHRRGPKGAGTVIQSGAQSWALRWTVDGKKTMKSGLSLLEAQAAQDRLRRGQVPFPEDVVEEQPRTIADVLPEFWDWRRERGLKSVRDDENRWKHLKELEPLALVTVGDREIAAVVRTLKAKKLSPASIGLALNLLSSLFKFARVPNPVSGYKTEHKRVITSQHDPDDTPFLIDPAKSKALRDELSKQAPVFGIAYAVSRWAGLRPGEVRALEWTDVDLDKGAIKVRRSVRLGRLGTPKSGEGRLVPIGPTLVETLRAWRQKQPGATLVCPALHHKPANAVSSKASETNPRNWSPYLNEAKLNNALETALAALKLEPMTLYEVGRHSFASDWATQGRSIYELSKVMGHASVTTTERYAHLGGGIKPLAA